MSAPNIVAFIFARGGSKGLPRKNVKPLAGVPLIGHAVTAALGAHGVTRCVVSTDDAEIAEIARQYGAETPFMRPAELATDKAPEWLAWRHAISTLQSQGSKIDIFLSVPTTAPLRLTSDIDACLDFHAKGGADVVVTVTEGRRSPYFNMVTLGENGDAELMIKPKTEIVGRQAAPKAYDMTTVAYVADPAFIMRANGLFEGRVRAVIVPPERAIDIDTELDFRFAELLMAERQRKG
jgi:CMP-N-acetylneuraminic acid synthetase